MNSIDPAGFCFVVVVIITVTGMAIMIGRGGYKPSAFLIILLMPLIYLFGVPIIRGEMSDWAVPLSSKIVLGVISSVIAGLIIHGIIKK